MDGDWNCENLNIYSAVCVCDREKSMHNLW